MNKQEYEQKRRECWEKFKRENLDDEVQWQPVSRYDVFCAAFDRAYALGKQEKDADVEPQPAEPKFKVGDKVRISCAFSSGEIWDSVLNGRVATIVGCYRESNNWIYCFKEPIRDFAEFWLEPCTEQGTLHCPSSETECYIPVRVPKMDEQRLNIATHITAAIYANYDVAKCFESIEAIVRKAVETADALIAGCKKE